MRYLNSLVKKSVHKIKMKITSKTTRNTQNNMKKKNWQY